MKIDLTNLPPDKQVAHVVAFVANRVESGRGRPQLIFATDLMEKFKHRGAGIGAERLKYFSGLLATANKVLLEAMKQRVPADDSVQQPTTQKQP